ncbi:MAG TPA: hypothetical protein VGS20_00970 [Candidatus Acidoferrales bacterium]|nr:hypothetical protein [Candidatus Acidoferrales bacterium]
MSKRYRGMGADARGLATYVKLLRAGENAIRETTRPLALYNLTSSQFGVLETLEDTGPQRLSELFRRNLAAGGNLAAVVETLRRRGLVRRGAGGRDRQSANVALTRKGRTLIRSIFPGHATAIVAFMSRLGPREQEALGKLCEKLCRLR